MHKHSFYRYVNTYNHYNSDKDTFKNFYNFPKEYDLLDVYKKNQFIENLSLLSTANSITKFYMKKNVVDFFIQQENFIFKWIKGKPIIFPYDNFFLQIEIDEKVYNLYFFEDKGGRYVSISNYKDDSTLIDSNFYRLENDYFDLSNLEIITPFSLSEENKTNTQLAHYYIWLIYILFYVSIYQKDLCCVEPNKNKKEIKKYKTNKINYAEYKILKIRKDYYKDFLLHNKYKKQKSWHMVMSHLRQLNDGRITKVKSHTRGSKKVGIILKDYEVSKGK
jgi:hypothetical protein